MASTAGRLLASTPHIKLDWSWEEHACECSSSCWVFNCEKKRPVLCDRHVCFHWVPLRQGYDTRRQKGAGEQMKSFRTALPAPFPYHVFPPSPTIVLIALILFLSRNSRKRLPFLDSVSAPTPPMASLRTQPTIALNVSHQQHVHREVLDS